MQSRRCSVRQPAPGIRSWKPTVLLLVWIVGTHSIAKGEPLDSLAAVSPSAVAAAPLAVPPIAAPKVGGYLQAREVVQQGVGLTTTLNRARLSADGALPAGFTYRMLVEFEASAGARAPATVSLREAMARWARGPWSIVAGQFKTPFTREYLIPVTALEAADLATAIDSLAPKYDVGMMGEVALGTWATLSAGVFNGEGQNATANRDSMVSAIGRIVARPVPQLSVGGSISRDGPDSVRWGADASVEQSGAVVRVEYLTRHRRGRARTSDDFGWTAFAGYRVTPRVQLIARQEDFKRPWIGASRRLSGTTLGANFEIAPSRVRLLVEGVRRIAGANRTRSDAGVVQLQLRF